jgi:hypothetical protein
MKRFRNPKCLPPKKIFFKLFTDLSKKLINMKKILIALFSIVLFLTACGKNQKSRTGITTTMNASASSIEENPFKPIVNVYIENSGSMNGYVKGVTEFEQAVYNYLTDIKISGISDSLNLFYINSKVIPQGSDIEDFILKLEPQSFQKKGGDLGTSDIANVLKSVLSETQENEIAILVTDGIFSPGKRKDASQYLVNQQIGIKNSMAEYLKLYPNTAVILYMLSSHFDGYYYNREDSKTYIKTQRPFFIWLIGPMDQLDKLQGAVPNSIFKGSGIQNSFSITCGNKEVNYAVKMGSGKFDLDRKSPKNTIKNLEKDTRGKQNTARFSVNANLSGFLLDNDYLKNDSNYEKNSKDFNLTVSEAANNSFGYTHQLNLSSENVHKGVISIKLKTQIPQWVEEVNDDDGSIPLEGKTYGIKYQISGIYEAFTFSNNFYTELKININ